LGEGEMEEMGKGRGKREEKAREKGKREKETGGGLNHFSLSSV